VESQDAFEGYGPQVMVGAQAPDITLRDEDGNEVALAAYWRERPVVLVFIRHFG
jgi:peroxiredoxin